jgi:hypothetical protein
VVFQAVILNDDAYLLAVKNTYKKREVRNLGDDRQREIANRGHVGKPVIQMEGENGGLRRVYLVLRLSRCGR